MAMFVYYCPNCKNMVTASLTGKCKVCGSQVNTKTLTDAKAWQNKSKEEQAELLANPERLIPATTTDKKVAYASKVVAAKPLGIAVSQEGSSGFYTNHVIYAFLLVFEDGHRELYQGKADDAVIKNILDKIEM